MYYVYELVDPRTGIPGYVGITNNPKARRAQHLYLLEDNPEKYAWVQRLRGQGINPIMRILDTASDRKQAEFKERHWINFYLETGISLTNIRGASDERPPFFKRLDDEWEAYQRESAILWKQWGRSREQMIDRVELFTGRMRVRFPSKKSILSLWEKQKLQEY